MMLFLQAPTAVLGVIALTLLPSITAKPYPVHLEDFRALHNASQIEKRQCVSYCGASNQYCCESGTFCTTSYNLGAPIATCVAGQAQATQAVGWQTYTSTWVTNGPVTMTTIWSSYVGPATAQAAPTGSSCSDPSYSPCGGTCCVPGMICGSDGNTCQVNPAGSSGGIPPGAPLRPTSSGLVIITSTGSATATVPFETPIATGVNGTLIPQTGGGGGGLSGGAIAGIVIGTILGIILLLLICFYCCARAAFNSILAIFGLGKKRKHTHEETYIEEHHHSSGGAAAAGGRRWYGQGAGRPSRPEKKSGGGKGLLGMGAALGGLALALGMKRKHDQRHDDKSTTISGSSAYYSDYTSSSSASSSDRHTRHTRHSSRR